MCVYAYMHACMGIGCQKQGIPAEIHTLAICQNHALTHLQQSWLVAWQIH